MITKDKLNEYIQEKEELLNKCNKTINKISLVRLIVFLAVAILGITCIVNFDFIILALAILSLVLFIFVIVVHDKKYQEVSYYKNYIQVLKEYKARFNYDWHKFKDKGEVVHSNLSSDIDLLGDNSLYQYLSVCKTSNAKDKLAHRLVNGLDSINAVNKARESIKDYASHFEENVAFQAHLKEFDKKIYRIKKNAVSFPREAKKSLITFVIGIITSLLLITSIVLSILKIISPSFILLFIFLQLSLSFIGKDKEILNSIDKAALYYHSLEKVYNHLINIKFENDDNKDNQIKIKNALLSIKKLNKIEQLSSIYHNGISSLIANMLMPFNDILLNSYIKFSKDNPLILEDSISALEHFEITASLANINFVNEVVCEPLITENIELEFKDIKHPLLNEEECISNSFDLKENINIITGSNMSGKTSFIRTIAINICLAKAGAFVTSASFKTSLYKLFTSMRVKDDIQNGISTFYAELLRIKDALDYSENKLPMILMVDEIFKGTNMNDRLLGAFSVMDKLNLEHVILFITTHDFELCDYEKVKLANYHFSEHYIDNKIKFDYKIKDGKCNTTNAVYLMKNTGIMD